ncbi:hypothetical protein ACR2R6_15685 [Methylocaldum gracile subsp. desertum]|uniref:hypothetical protein n=1 Tax=Methylocaldum sp. GT1BW TaxID=3438964 RepID=UPI003D9FE4A1
MSLEEEISKVTELKHVGLALLQYVQSLVEGTEFQAHERRWVARPHNFVTFEVHWQRARNITISLRGNPSEFIQFSELPLKGGMAGYSECKVTSTNQLRAASSYIARAAELYKRGSRRIQKKPVVLE